MNTAASLSPVTSLSTRWLVALITLLAAFTLMSASASVQASQRFATYLNGAQETPPNPSAGYGYGSVVLSDDQTTITVNLGYTNLGSFAIAAIYTKACLAWPALSSFH